MHIKGRYFFALISILVLIIAFILYVGSHFGSETEVIKQAHLGPIETLQLLPGDLQFVTSGQDKKIAFWSVETGKSKRNEYAKGLLIRDFAISDHQQLLAGVGDAGILAVWDIKDFSSNIILPPEPSSVHSIAFSENRGYLVAVAHDIIILYNVGSDKDVKHFQSLRAPVDSSAFVRASFINDSLLVSSSRNGEIVTWNFNLGKLRESVETGIKIQDMIVLPDKERAVIAGNRDGKEIQQLELWNIAKGKQLAEIGQCKGSVLDLFYHDKGKYVIASCSRDLLKKYFLDTSKQPVEILPEFKPGIQNLAFSDKMNTFIYHGRNTIYLIRNFD